MTVTGSNSEIARTTSANALRAGAAPHRHTSVRTGSAIHVPACGVHSAGMVSLTSPSASCSCLPFGSVMVAEAAAGAAAADADAIARAPPRPSRRI